MRKNADGVQINGAHLLNGFAALRLRLRARAIGRQDFTGPRSSNNLNDPSLTISSALELAATPFHRRSSFTPKLKESLIYHAKL
jgi:hypothetical protein